MTTRLPAFEVLVDMARNDPEGLETLRRSLTNAVIATASNDHSRRRLEGLQFRVDLERRRAATPLAATIRISEMMCRSLADLHASFVTPLHPGEDANIRQTLQDQETVSGGRSAYVNNVVPFQRG